MCLHLLECLQTSHILKYKFQIPNSSLFFRILEFQSQNFVHILSFDADLRIPRIMNYEIFTRRNTSYETIAISPTTFISTPQLLITTFTTPPQLFNLPPSWAPTNLQNQDLLVAATAAAIGSSSDR
jgi:hypothetical protein